MGCIFSGLFFLRPEWSGTKADLAASVVFCVSYLAFVISLYYFIIEKLVVTFNTLF